VELEHLHAAVGAVEAGCGSALFLVGEAGIGKSRLARAVAAEAAGRGFAVLWGRAVEGSAPLPYRPFAEALSSAVRARVGPGPEVLAPFRASLSRLVPEWRGERGALLDESLLAVGEGVLRFLAAAAGHRGSLLVLEDLQWADPETITIVEYLADQVHAERVMVLATVRDAPSRGLDLARSLRARRGARLLEVSPLPADEVAAVVASCLTVTTVPDDVLLLAARAEGVPFVVEELLAAALAAGALVEEDGTWLLTGQVDAVVPRSLAENLRRRVDLLGHDCERVVTAVLGRSFPWELLPDRARARRRPRRPGPRCRRVGASRPGGGMGGAGGRARARRRRRPARCGALPRGGAPGARPWCVGQRRGDARPCSRSAASWRHPEPRHRGVTPGGAVARGQACTRRRGGGVDAHPAGGQRSQARRRVEIHLRLGRAAIAATQWDEAHEFLERARQEIAATDADEDLRARLDALRAQVAVVREPAQAPLLAHAAGEVAEQLGLPDVGCEALEILGRSHRLRDLDAAEEAFTRALTLPTD
jgi:hypothetical protein